MTPKRAFAAFLLALAGATIRPGISPARESSERPDTTIYQPPARVTGQYHNGTIYDENNRPKYYINGDRIYDANNPGHVVYQIVPKDEGKTSKK